MSQPEEMECVKDATVIDAKGGIELCIDTDGDAFVRDTDGVVAWFTVSKIREWLENDRWSDL